MISLILATMMAAWNPPPYAVQTGYGTAAINLAGGTGCNYIELPALTTIDGKTSWSAGWGLSTETTAWPSAVRQLFSRWGSTTATRELLVKVGPASTGMSIEIDMMSSTSSITFWRYESPMPAAAMAHAGLIVKDGTAKPKLYLWQTATKLMGEVPLRGPANAPAMLKTATGVKWLYAGKDCLQKTVYNFALWDTALTESQIQTIWNRGAMVDLSSGTGVGPQGAAASYPVPGAWYPMGTGDSLPTVHSGVGGPSGTCYRWASNANQPCTATLSGNIPMSAHYEAAADPVAAWRQEVDSWLYTWIDPRGHRGNGVAMLQLGTSSIALAHHRASNHLADGGETYLDISDDLGVSLPNAGRTWPGSSSREFKAIDVDIDIPDGMPSGCHARGSRMFRTPSGRIIWQLNYNCSSDYDGFPERWTLQAHSDDNLETLSPWTSTGVDIGTQWCSEGAVGAGGAAVRSDGSFCDLWYCRDIKIGTNPPESEGSYYDPLYCSYDDGGTWDFDNIVADGEPNKQLEESQILVLDYAIGSYAVGVWFATFGLDYPPPRSTLIAHSFDEGRGGSWTAPVFAFEGRAWPALIQLKHDSRHPILALSRAPDISGIYGQPQLHWTFDGDTWEGGIRLGRPGDGSDTGHSILELDDGTILIQLSTEMYNANGGTQASARTELIKLRPGLF